MSSDTTKKSVTKRAAAILFAQNFLKYPSMLGSVIPSSRFLVNDLLQKVDWDRAHVVVEFGPGIGTFTHEILKRMRKDAVLVIIEVNSDFVKHLDSTINDPRLRLVHGSAADVRRILGEQNLAPADYIISGLPYSLMPEDLRREVITESRNALQAHGSLLVFQYTGILLPYLTSSFSSVRQGFQLFNILPARIFHCTP
jgi:phospholipid N-methyltransferase